MGVIAVVGFIVIDSYGSYGYSSNPFYYKQWYLENVGDERAVSDSADYRNYLVIEPGIDISAVEMWDMLGGESSGEPVIVAIIDTAIDYTHEDLRGNMWLNAQEIAGDGVDNDDNGFVDDIHGYNFCEDSGDLLSVQTSPFENAHGTMCAGIIAANDNEQGIVGIAQNINVRLMSLKVLDSEDTLNSGDTKDLIRAIKYANENGAKVCNISMSTDEYNQELKEVMQNSSMLFVISAGNGLGRGLNISQVPVYPAAFGLSNTIVVANLNYTGNINKESNYSPQYVDIAAPGTCIYSTFPENQYEYGTGTSMSAAIVSGVAAEICSLQEDFSPEEIKRIILSTVNETNGLKNRVASSGFVNASGAVKMALAME